MKSFMVLLFSYFTVSTAMAAKYPSALVFKCQGNNNQVMTGLIRGKGPSKMIYRGKKYNVTRVDPSITGGGFVVMGRSGNKFLKFIGTTESKIQTNLLAGNFSPAKNKDFVNEKVKVICHLKAT